MATSQNWLDDKPRLRLIDIITFSKLDIVLDRGLTAAFYFIFTRTGRAKKSGHAQRTLMKSRAVAERRRQQDQVTKAGCAK